jgi:uncharacterized membrane protein (DUF2068 family)
MEEATARRLQWVSIVILVGALVGAVAAVELWSNHYWDHPIGIVSRLALIAVVMALFVAVNMQARQRPGLRPGGDDRT